MLLGSDGAGTDSESCSMLDFGITGAESSDSVTSVCRKLQYTFSDTKLPVFQVYCHISLQSKARIYTQLFRLSVRFYYHIYKVCTDVQSNTMKCIRFI
jgi:hypothetical protein